MLACHGIHRMCGLTGFFQKRGLNASDARQIAQSMASQIAHRGPDDLGVWLDENAGIALAHRRLSILDLSKAGHQPMASASGRLVISFNGEIYNHLDLRKQLDHPWKSQTDTETLLTLIERFGLEATLKLCVGMFAFALWDKSDQTLILARDRFGEKPLYYGLINDVFLFASELKAMKCHPAFRPEIDRNALSSFLRHSNIAAPHSIYKGVFKLPAGCWIQINKSLTLSDPIPYWSMHETAAFGIKNQFQGTPFEALDALEALLIQSINGQMLADVPLGAFLSGGIDSSTIVALMQSLSNKPIKTFTIGFEEQAYDEAGHALAVAKHLRTDHTELYVSVHQAMEVIPKLPQIYDEPFSDASQIPTYLVSSLAKKQVTVSLSGDGGDELFAGYNRHVLGQTLWKKIGWLPLELRMFLAQSLSMLTPQSLNNLFDKLSPLLPNKLRIRNPGDKIQKLSNALNSKQGADFYSSIVSHWDHPDFIVLNGQEAQTVLNDQSLNSQFKDLTQYMMLLDSLNYLQNDILTKVDRAAMSIGLETRVPFLDHRLVEFAWSLPLSMKINQGQGKYILRQILDKYVPKHLIERPKMGFAIPLDVWLRRHLRDWAESLLDETRLKQEGFFNPKPIRQKWIEHLSGQFNWQYHLWDILMFQAWLEDQH